MATALVLSHAALRVLATWTDARRREIPHHAERDDYQIGSDLWLGDLNERRGADEIRHQRS